MEFLVGRKESEGEGIDQSSMPEDLHNTEGIGSPSRNEQKDSDSDRLSNEDELPTPPSMTDDHPPATDNHDGHGKVRREDMNSGNIDREILTFRDEADKVRHSHGGEFSGSITANRAAASSSRNHEEFETNDGSSLESPRVPSPKESKPSSSQLEVTEDSADPLEFEESRSDDSRKNEEEFIKKGFKCGGNAEEEDEELREYWTRALQTSTSSGEIVEEIVKVLKHHQKTHDLLCPVCGSCVTRRVILRKRKRSSLISVDQWYRDSLDGDELREEEGTLAETMEAEVQETDSQDIEAFGCLACFSLFYDKGIQLLSQLQEMGPETLNCLPFFFPPYPWGITQIRDRRTGTQAEITHEEVAEEVPSQHEQDALLASEGRDFTCGIGSALLPEYSWGTTHLLSKGKPSDLTKKPADVGSYEQEAEERREEIVDLSHDLTEDRVCDCGVVPNFLPAFPWGICKIHKRDYEDAILQSDIEAGPEEPIPLSSPSQTASQPEISEAVPQRDREERICTCGLLPALLPDYYWGTSMKDKDTVVKSMPEMEHNVAEDTMRSERVPFLQNGPHLNIGSAVLPPYPWGTCSVHAPFHEENGNLQPSHDDADGECTCGLTMLPKFPWGQASQTILTDQTILTKEKLATESKQPQTPTPSSQEVKSYIEQETKIEAKITSKTDVYTVTSSKTTYPGEIPPDNIKTITPHETSQTIKHLKLDQTVTVINATIKVDEKIGAKGPTPIASAPSTGFALFDEDEEDFGGKGKLQTRPSTGYAQLEELIDEQEAPKSEIQEDTAKKSYHKHEKPRPQILPTGLKFPSFEWFFGKLNADEVKTPLLEASSEPENETIISVLKPTPVGVDKPKSENWVSIFKVPKPLDESGVATPLLSPISAQIEEIEEVKHPVSQPQLEPVDEAVIDVATAPDLAIKEKKESDDWDILKSIVYGGLDISIASFGVTSSAAGGNAITRTVVYMGLATLFSGLIGFYHNVLNLYHLHRDYYVNVVGLTLMLHGTVAIVSYFVFGLLSPLVYAFSYRKSDDRDDKFILCCVVTFVAVTVLSLCKAKVSKKPYIRTLISYLGGGFLAAVIGYLTGEHIAELLEEWGI